MFQAQSDDDDAGDDVAINVDAGGFMEQFFEQVRFHWVEHVEVVIVYTCYMCWNDGDGITV